MPHEVFNHLYPDNRHRVISFEVLFRGTIDGATVRPQAVARAALRRNSAALISTHRDPSGLAKPSDADRRLNRRLEEALVPLDIRVLDHFVVGYGEVSSFCRTGLAIAQILGLARS